MLYEECVLLGLCSKCEHTPDYYLLIVWHDIVDGAGHSSVQRQSPGQSDDEPYDDPLDEAYDNAFDQATHELHCNAHQNGSAIYGDRAPPKSKMSSQFVGCRWSDTHDVEETLYDVRQTPQTRRQIDTRHVEETAYDVQHNSARIDTRVLPSARRFIAHTRALVLDKSDAQVGVGNAQLGVADAYRGDGSARIAVLRPLGDGSARVAVLRPLGKVQGEVQDYERVGAQLRDLDALIRKATQPDHTDKTSPHALPSSPSHTHTTHTHTHTQAPPYWSARAQGLAHIDSSVEDESQRLLPPSYRLLPPYPGGHGAGASAQASDIGEYKGGRSVAASAAAVSTSSTTSLFTDTGASSSASLSRGPTHFVVPPPCTYDVNTAGPPSYWSLHAHGFALHDHLRLLSHTTPEGILERVDERVGSERSVSTRLQLTCRAPQGLSREKTRMDSKVASANSRGIVGDATSTCHRCSISRGIVER